MPLACVSKRHEPSVFDPKTGRITQLRRIMRNAVESGSDRLQGRVGVRRFIDRRERRARPEVSTLAGWPELAHCSSLYFGAKVRGAQSPQVPSFHPR